MTRVFFLVIVLLLLIASLGLNVFATTPLSTLVLAATAKDSDKPIFNAEKKGGQQQKDESKEQDKKGVINFVLLGATGNLAQKYLWQALFNIHRDLEVKNAPTKLFVWPAATKGAEVGAPLLKEILENNITTNGNTPQEHLEKQRFLKDFVAGYTQLKSSEHFANLGEVMRNRMKSEVELSRVFYLSVPPKVFGSIAKEINQHLRPTASDIAEPPRDKLDQASDAQCESDLSQKCSNGGARLKVLVEKPFGSDLQSAESLADELFRELSNEEIFLVDHYLGKPGVSGIREFRSSNPHYEGLLNHKHVKSVEVAMEETEDLSGRTSFYEEVGVIRDTMQNHLMAMATLVAMDISDGDAEPENRMEAVRSMVPLRRSNVRELGQYADYAKKHLPQDAKTPPSGESNTPTMARVELFSTDPRWMHVPFIFSSGKALASRNAYTRITFTSGEQLLINVHGTVNMMGNDKNLNELVSGSAIYATSLLPAFQVQNVSSSSSSSSSSEPPTSWEFITPGKHAVLTSHSKTPSAYEVILRDAFEDRQETFMRLPEVLESWRIWTPLLDELKEHPIPLKKYKHGEVSFV